MHSAYLKLFTPARRWPGRMLAAAMFLLPGTAWAAVAVDADGSVVPPLVSSHALSAAIGACLVVLFAFAIMMPFVMVLNAGVQALWKAAFKTQPPFSLYSAAATVVALLLGAYGAFVVPQFSEVFASWGADLPTPTRLLMDYSYLLPAASILFLGMLFLLQKNAQRERYFAVLLAGELAMVVLIVWAQQLPIFVMGEAVSA